MSAKAEALLFQTYTVSQCLVFHTELRRAAGMTADQIPIHRILAIQHTIIPPNRTDMCQQGRIDPILSRVSMAEDRVDLEDLPINWLRVLGTAERAQIDQCIRHHLHAIVPLLDPFKAEQQSFELIFPGKGAFDAHPQHMNRSVEEAFAPPLGGLTVAGIFLDIGDQAGIENALAIVRGVKAAIKVEIGPSQVQPNLFGHLLQGFQALWEQDHVGLIDGRHGDGR